MSDALAAGVPISGDDASTWPTPEEIYRWDTERASKWAKQAGLSEEEQAARAQYAMDCRYPALKEWLERTAQVAEDAVRDESPAPVTAASVFVDVTAVLDGGLTAPAPDGGPPRTDGAMVLYRGKVNVLFGDPESAKTLFALAVLAHELQAGRHAFFVDTDHNGAEFVLRFLLGLGVPRDVLVARLHYAEPDDREELLRVVEAVAALEAGAVVLDSVGENLSHWGVSSNDDQGFIDMNRATAARLAKAGHLVITIDHLAKNTDSRRYGATGTTAKLRAANGAVYEVRVIDEFSPDDGGKSALLLKKDRIGGVRALGHKKGETVAVFELSAPDAAGEQTVTLHPGGQTTSGSANATVASAAGLAADVAALAALTPPPRSKTDVMARMGWGTTRALDALRAWRSQNQTPAPAPGPQPQAAPSSTTGGRP